MILVLSILFLPFLGKGSIDDVHAIHDQVYQIMDNQPDSALLLCDRAIAIADDIDYRWGVANTYYIKGFILEEIQKKPVAGLFMYLRSGYLLENENGPKAAKTFTSVYLNGGSILRSHGKYREAIDLYDQAIARSMRYDLQGQKLKLLFNKGFALDELGDREYAFQIVSSTIDLATELENNKILFDSWNLLGFILKDDNRIKEAKTCFEKVIFNEGAARSARANSANNLADLFFSEDNLDSAIHFYQLAINHRSELKVIPFYSYSGLAASQLKNGNISGGIENGMEALRLFQLINPEKKHFGIFNVMSDLHLAQGNSTKSQFYSKKYFRITQEYFDNQEAVIEIKNEFQVDLLLAGFQKEIELERAQADFEKWSLIVGTTFLVIIVMLYGIYRHRLYSSYLQIKRIVEDYN